MKVRFIKSAAPIGLSHAEGSIGDFPLAQAKELMESAFAVAADEEEEDKPIKKTATTSKDKEVKTAVVEK